MIARRSTRIVRALLRPEVLFRQVLRRFSFGSFEFRLAFDAVDRPWYGHGIYEAARLAQRLKEPAVSVIEFGVAQGEGLVAMEKLASEVQALLGVNIQVFGFDSGQGLPAHEDYRDLPYVWQRGFYSMKVEAVHGRLQTARLILGDVQETVPNFLKEGGFAPIGFISFDLDYYTSTKAALRIFDGSDDSYLPRILTYFDDILSSDQQYHCEDVGELLAIREFNESPERHRIRPINGWTGNLPLQSAWGDAMYAYHRFDHNRYCEYIGSQKL
jgi:hypothetical protein